MSYCQHCGASVEPFYKYCGTCGATVHLTSDPSISQTSDVKASKYNYCQDCGNNEPKDVLFCQVCKSDRMEPTKPDEFPRPSSMNKMIGLQLGFAVFNVIIGIVIYFEGGISPMEFGIAYASIAVLTIALFTLYLAGKRIGRTPLMAVSIIECFVDLGFGTIIGIIMAVYLSRPRVKAHLSSPGKLGDDRVF